LLTVSVFRAITGRVLQSAQPFTQKDSEACVPGGSPPHGGGTIPAALLTPLRARAPAESARSKGGSHVASPLPGSPVLGARSAPSPPPAPPGAPARRSVAAMSYAYPKPITVPAKGEHSATFIMLHGLGDTGNGWSDVAQQLALPHVKCVFPTAPTRPISINMGMSMPGWYDIRSLDKLDGSDEDAEGVRESVRYVEGLVQAEVDAGVPSDRVVVGGFSQGGAVALMMLRSGTKLGGVAALSTYLMLRDEALASDANAATRVFMAHGDSDQVVAFPFGDGSRKKLQEAGLDVDWKVYPGMPHSACMEELQHLKEFLLSVVPAK